jgi:uncharacterized membrane protein YheB (UPF0754 family)
MTTYEFVQLASLPVVSALIGWITNYIAVKMLFRPRHPWSIFKIQGLLPKRQKELALKVAATVEGKLISLEDVMSKLDDKAVHGKIEPLVRDTIDSFIQKKLVQMPMIGMFLQGEMLEQIKEMLVAETLQAVPKMVGVVGDSLQENVSFKKIIQERIESFDLSVLEEIVYEISGNELRAIELLGGVLGFLIGLIQVAIILL